MRNVQTWEGYYSNGSFHIHEPIIDVPENVHILITILDNNPINKRDTWDEFDKLVDDMNEKPNLTDFPRCELNRSLVNFNEVQL
jgi:hypothetical protein